MNDDEIKEGLEYAKSMMNIPYVWGGNHPLSGMDCCLAEGTLVQTPKGFKAIESFLPGDTVFSYSGGRLVTSIVEDVHQNGVKPTLKVKTTASTIYCTSNHKFLAFCADKTGNIQDAIRTRRVDWVMASELSERQAVVMARKIKQKPYRIYSHKQLYFFGAMLGDGHLTEKGCQLCFVSERKLAHKDRMIDYARAGFGYNGNPSWNASHGISFCSMQMKKNLMKMGFSKDKSPDRTLPDWLFLLCDSELDSFLQGYLLADGSRFMRKSESGYTLSSASKSIIYQLHALLLSRGKKIQNINVHQRNKEIIIKGRKVKDPKTLYTISINDNDINPVPERGAGLNPHDRFGLDEQFTIHKITSIDQSREVATYDLTIKDSHSYVAAGYVVHNSGFVQQYLASIGMDPPGDQNSQMLYDHFMTHGHVIDHPEKGCLIFFGKSDDRISHVAICLNKMQMIEAGGAGRLSDSLESARLYGGCVRVRPIKRRKDLVRFISPCG